MTEDIDLAEVKCCLDGLAMESIILCQFCLRPTKQDGNKLGVVES